MIVLTPNPFTIPICPIFSEQRLLRRHMELLLVRRDLKAKIEKREVEETISQILKQKERLDKTILSII